MPSLVSTLVPALVAVLFSSHVQATSPIISMYWPAYSTATQPPSDIPWSQASIMNYFVTVTTATGLQIPDGQTTSDIQSFVSLAKSNKVRPVFSVGGWDGSLYYSSLLATSTSRKSFAGDLSSFATKWGFEGVDLDWEYPNKQGIGCNNISSADSANLLLFAKELKSQLGSSKIITAAVSMTGFVGPDGTVLTDFSEYAKYIDFINVMSYDVTGSWGGKTGPNSPLNQCDSDAGADTAIEVWTAGGFPANQILLGTAAYGYAFTTTSSQLSNTTIGSYESQIYQPMASTTPKGDSTDVYNTGSTDVCGTFSSGYSGNWEMNELISQGLLSSDEKTGKSGFTRYWDDCTSTPFLFNPSTKVFITYDDSESIGLKAAFAVKKGLAGLFVFDSIGFTNDVYTSMKEGLGLTGASSSSESAEVASATSHESAAASSLGTTVVAPTTTAIPTLGEISNSESITRFELTSPGLASDDASTAELTSTAEPTSEAEAVVPTSATSASSDNLDVSGTSTASLPTSTIGTSSSSSGSSSQATLKCLTSTTFALCDGTTCTNMGSVAAGTMCVDGGIVVASKARMMRKARGWSP
ncbi:chitinase, partial [Phenoliferia sp. Uapishka_3]